MKKLMCGQFSPSEDCTVFRVNRPKPTADTMGSPLSETECKSIGSDANLMEAKNNQTKIKQP